MSTHILFICVLLWGTATFLNRLAVDKMPAVLLQGIVGVVYLFFIPIAFRLSGVSNPFTYKWTPIAIACTVGATFCSIFANIFLYSTLKGSDHTGSSAMIIALYPVVTLFLSAVFLHEQFTTIKIVGICYMIFGAILLSLK